MCLIHIRLIHHSLLTNFTENSTEYDQRAIFNADYNMNETEVVDISLLYYAGSRSSTTSVRLSRVMYLDSKLFDAVCPRLVGSD